MQDWHGRASIKRRPSDDALVLTYRRGTAHDVNDGALHIRFSDDHGVTWTAEDTRLGGVAVTEFPMNPPVSAGQDAGEPWLMVAPNGDLLLHMWRVDYGVSVGGSYQSRSSDGGHTWSAAAGPIQFAGLTEAQNDRTFSTDDDFVHEGTIYAGARVYTDVTLVASASVLITSDDDGVTWTRLSTIVSAVEAGGLGTQEVGLEYVGNDTIIAMLRDNAHEKSYRRVSTDMGVTWGTLEDVTALVGIAGRQRIYTQSHLQGLATWWDDPNLIMVGFSHQASGQSFPRRNAIWTSSDSGDTWAGPHYLDARTEDAGYGDVFYDPITGRYKVIIYQGTVAAADLVQYDLSLSDV